MTNTAVGRGQYDWSFRGAAAKWVSSPRGEEEAARLPGKPNERSVVHTQHLALCLQSTTQTTNFLQKYLSVHVGAHPAE